MDEIWILVLVVAFSGVSLALKEEDYYQVKFSCPTWTNYVPSTNSCECGANTHHVVSCIHIDKNFYVTVLYGYCMTLTKYGTKVIVGSCPFTASHQYSPTSPSLLVPSNASDLDHTVCSYTSRTGQLCGQCKNGTSPPVYSYYPQCVHCPAGTNNWAKYLAVSLLPTTLFFLGALLLRFRATSPHLNGYILLSQVVTSPIILRHVAQSYYVHHYQHNYIGIAGNVYFSYLGLWNLDFFRLAYTPFCLYPSASMLKVLSLDYIIAAYPLVLIILTYTLVTLHYYNCRLVVWLWRPFLRCCIRFQRQWDIRNSLVDAFATFLLLSYVKFLSVSLDILSPTVLWDARGHPQQTVLYYDGTVEYFSKEHLPYAVLAITVLLVFTILPILLLCLYPCHCFQRFMNNCHLRSQALYMFMDAFQGCYKNGTNGTTDCRYFSAVYLITRIAVQLSLVFVFVYSTTSVLTVVLAVVILLLSVFHPCKEMFYNRLDILFFLTISVCISAAWILHDDKANLTLSVDRVILLVCAPIPIIYPLCILLHHIWKRSRRLQRATEWIRAFFASSKLYHNFEESLPRRVTMNETSCLLREKNDIQ